MSRALQHRDISDPIARIVREHLTALEIPTIHHTPLIRDLTTEMTDVVLRAVTEAYEDGKIDNLHSKA
jgi:hypothetical protein